MASGLNVIQGAKFAGAARIIAIDRSPAKLALASTLGATDVLTAADDVVDQVRELTQSGVGYSFEAVGTTTTAELAVQSCAQLG